VEETAPSPLRSCVLGTMAFSSGQLGEAEQLFSRALAQARDDPGSQPLAALIAGRLAGTYSLLGDGEKVMTLGRWALGTGHLGAAATSQIRAVIAIGASQAAGPHAALAELEHLDADPARVSLVDVDSLSLRGVLGLQTGDLGQAVRDLTASLRLSRKGATLLLGLRACCYLALAQYLAGQWDDVLLTSEQGFSAAAIHSRHYELPLLHLAAACVPAGRGAAEEAERHAEGLIGSGQTDGAAVVLERMRAEDGQVSYVGPALAWLEGWLAEHRGAPEEAQRIYQRGEETASTQSPVHVARLLLAHGRLLRRTGERRGAVDRLRRANDLYTVLRAEPFIARTEEELAKCRLPSDPARKQPVLALTSRETEVAHLVGKGLPNPEIAAELFISRKAVEYHLGNIYAKCGVQGRQQLRRLVQGWRQPTAV
jgi:DNA-binding CsgD family transcriptional regulator